MWDHRVAWSILWALGAWDSGSNPGGPTLYLSRLSSIGRALDCRSKCCWFKSGRRDFYYYFLHYFEFLNFHSIFNYLKIGFVETFIYNNKYSNLMSITYSHSLPWWCRGYHVGLSSPRLGFKSRPGRLTIS